MEKAIQAAVTAKKEQQLATAQPQSIRDYIRAMAPEIKKALPSVITPERFTRITLSALSASPRLAETTPQSFLAAMMTSAQLGLEPNTPLGQAYLIPRYNKNKDCYECSFEPGYKGLMDLAYRSGRVSLIQAHAVHANDEFSYAYGLEPTLKHVPAAGDRGDVVNYYAMFKTKDGGFGFSVMSLDDIKKHRDRYSESAKKGYSPWATNFDEMAKKTVLKKVLKYAPLSSEAAAAVSSDGVVREDISDDMFAEPVHYVEVDDNGEIRGDGNAN